MTDKMKNMIIVALNNRYEKNKKILNRDFLRMEYEDYEIECLKEEQRRIKEIIEGLK